MLPISVSIGSKGRLFIPLLYLLVTTIFCYFFLIAFVATRPEYSRAALEGLFYRPNTNYLSDSLPLEPTPRRNFSPGINIKSERGIRDFRFEGLEGQGEILAKKEFKYSKPSNHDATWRSNSAQIRSRHSNGLLDPFKINGLNGTAYTLWPNDSQCKKYTVRFARKKTFKPRALVSFPGSGNSWVRYLIEGATGFFTGSVFNDKDLHKNGLRGELASPNDGTTIVQKTHHDSANEAGSRKALAFIKLSELMFGYRGILLIRNPYDALRSYFNYFYTKSHKATAPSSTPQNTTIRPVWTHFVKSRVGKWSSLIKDWTEKSSDLHILTYEKMREEPRREISRLLAYFKLPEDPQRLDCLMKHIEGPFQRKHENDHLNRFPPNVGKALQEDIESVNVLFSEWSIPLHLNYTFH